MNTLYLQSSKSPWNTLGISNQIKRVFLMWIKMFNIGIRRKLGFQLTLFPSPASNHSMMQHFGDILNTFAHLNIAQGSGGAIFPKEA